MNISDADLDNLSQNALLKLVKLAETQEARLQKECEAMYLKMRSLDREFEDLAHPVVKSKKSSEQEAKESLSELKRLEERVQLLTLATSFGNELRVPENGKDDVTRRLGMEVKEVNEAKKILSKLVGKKGIRKGYEEVKKDLTSKRLSRQQSELEVSHERDEDSEDDAFNY